MDWHPPPKDDAWRQAHLAMLERLGKDKCAHTVFAPPRELAELHRLDMLTLLLTISRWMQVYALRSAERWLSAGAA